MPAQIPGTQSPPTEHPPEVGSRALRGLCWGSRGAQKPHLLAAGRALERRVKVNAHVGSLRPPFPAVASRASSAQAHTVKDYEGIQLESRDSSVNNTSKYRIGWNL